jgi:nucleotide sugar dehydrogenase
MHIGLIGHGFVGGAVYENLKNDYKFLIYDRKPAKANCENIKQVVDNAEVIFVALPTPMYSNGECDLTIIFAVMSEIYQHYKNNIIILKSTVLPGTCQEIRRRHPDMRIVFSPEFLTEANYIEDFKNCNRMIFGGDARDTAECVRLLQTVFPSKYYFTTDWETAETVKYFINTFLATKVSFANEMKQICDVIGTDYNKVVKLALYDDRIGKSHLKVPGPDGYSGFGGKCFPKDLNALMYFSLTNDIKPVILKASWEKNLEVREEHDWLNIEGATTKGNYNE